MPGPSVFGQKVTLTATVAPDFPGDPKPAGSVTFVDQTTGTTLGTATLHGGTASLSTATLAVGAHDITATYSGSSRFLASLDQTTQIVSQAQTSTSVTSSLSPSIWGQNVSFTAVVSLVSPGGGTPTGTVAFYDGTNLLGSATLSGGKATLKTAAVTVGSQTITVVYSGSAQFRREHLVWSDANCQPSRHDFEGCFI